MEVDIAREEECKAEQRHGGHALIGKCSREVLFVDI
jgi:hypothetical protein